MTEKNLGKIPLAALVLFLGLIGIAGFVLILWITPFGPSVSPDSTVYIGGAKSLLSGNGYSLNGNPITHFPPLYPLFLAVTGLLENNLVQAARFLNAILFGVNLGLFALAVYLTVGHSFLTTICAVFFFLSSAPILELHSSAWSEPLFITFSLACLILLSKYIINPTLPLLIASSFSLGFALVTRYTGLGFLPAALAIVFFGRGGEQFGRRFRETVAWPGLACAPLGIFFIRNMVMIGSPTDRSFAYHPLPLHTYLSNLISNVFDYIAPIRLPPGVRPAIFGLIAVFFIALLIIFFRRFGRDINWRSMGIWMPISCFLFSVSYLLFLFLSISFMDASTPVDIRLLSPILIILTVGIFSATWVVTQKLGKSLVWWCFLLFVVLSIIIKLPGTIRFAVDIQKNGLGYTAQQWRDLESITFVKLLAEDTKIYSNGSDVISYLTEKKSLSIPAKTSSITMRANPAYNAEITAMCRDITDNRAYLVYFTQITWRWYLPTQEEIESTCKLPVLHSFLDGTVYGKR